MKVADFFRIVFQRKKRSQNVRVLFASGLQVILSVLSPVSIQMLGYIVDMAYAKAKTGSLALLYLSLCAGIFLVAVIRSKKSSIIKCDIESTLRNTILHRVYSDNVGKNQHGEIFTLSISQSEEFAQDAWQIILSAIDLITTFLVVFSMMVQIDRTISFIILPLLLFLTVLTMIIMRLASKTHLLRQEGSRKFSSVVSEEIYLLKEMRIFPMLNLLSTRYAKVEQDKFDADSAHARAVFYSLTAERVSHAISFSFLICLSAVLLRQGKITDGQVLVMINYVSALLYQLSQVNYIVDMWLSNRAIWEKIEQLSAPIQTDTFFEDTSKLDIHSIDINGICLRYGENVVFNDYSMHIHAGEKIALMGPSGTGKTALLKAVLGLVPLSGGNIVLNGIGKLPMNDLRESIAYLSQTPFFFAGTIYENLQWANPRLTHAEAEEILLMTNLSHLALDRRILEKGADLSGGERQRLSFARCLAKKATFWLLDEPFAQLDAENRAILGKDIKNAADITMLISTHVDIPEIADRVISLENRG